ncbi:hypothetical protein ABEV54_15570 [Peribacillus psychrosaccharolyticus]|nr:hypothetical protein [Peribacillus psychrosaccharolyticus]MEC2056663.1 hypothetical protein [Peribacillus psychrosaccharolyticus]MED3746117.1 hypothetical protein [Peribacillus psychrosaccharolyticus]
MKKKYCLHCHVLLKSEEVFCVCGRNAFQDIVINTHNQRPLTGR